ncbi:MAG: RND transporter, partial [Desulfobacter sp.]|nr:RND transporter [Desulfobacter sp.]
MENNNKIVHYALIGVSLLTFAGCAVGPDFQRPEPPDVTGYTSSPLAANLNSSPTMLGDPQNIIKEERLNKYWWREMGTEQLDTLIC